MTATDNVLFFYAKRKLPISACITMNLKLGVIHLLFPPAKLDVTSGNPNIAIKSGLFGNSAIRLRAA